MKLVIEIPEELYNNIKRNQRMTEDDAVKCYDAIQIGIPLPKGHGDLIDRDELELDAEWDDYYDDWCSYSDIQIRNAPTIIEADKRGV